MFWWNVDGLARALRAGAFSEQEKARYFAALIVLVLILVTLYRLMPVIPCTTKERLVLDICAGVFYSPISLWGILNLNQVNKAGDNRDYIERIILLSLPISLRLISYLLIFAIPIGVIRAFLPLSSIWGTQLTQAQTPYLSVSFSSCYASWFGLIVTFILLIFFFVWLKKKIIYVSQAPDGIKLAYISFDLFTQD